MLSNKTSLLNGELTFKARAKNVQFHLATPVNSLSRKHCPKTKFNKN